jgi:cell division initiation protein
MKITPIEIRQKEFEKVFRGYEKEAVDAFLQSLSVEWERLMDDNKILLKRAEVAEKEIDRLREVETSLFRTLKSAEETGNTLIEAANKKSELYIKEAQMNANNMLTEARFKSKSLLEDAEEKAKEMVSTLLNDIKDIELSYHQIAQLKDHLVRDVKHTLADISERIVKQTHVDEDLKAFDAKIKAIKSTSTEKIQEYTELQSKTTSLFEATEPKSESDIIVVKEGEKPINDNTEKSFFDQL